jgi:purine-binding chemotaxis protein CheW
MTEENRDTESSQYLSFVVDGKLFGFDVLKTKEVLIFTDVTPIPGAPPYIRGVLNLRGSVVPVVDMRRKFGMSESVITDNTAVIIVETSQGGEKITTGVLVDEVRGVLRFEAGAIEPPPKMGSAIGDEVIEGIAKLDSAFVLIVNIDRAFSDEAAVSAVDDRE